MFGSHNHSNSIEIIKHSTSYNNDGRSIILKNTPYIIKKEIDDVKYYVIIDESQDELKKRSK